MKLVIIFFVSLSLLCCSKEPGGLNTPSLFSDPIDTLQISLANNEVVADNYTYAEIIAVTHMTEPTNRLITFTTDKGLFSNSNDTFSLQTSANDTTRAYLRCNKADLTRVTVTVMDTYSKELYVNFVPAYPDQIQVNPDSTVLTRTYTAHTIIKSKLLRTLGTASEGQIVHFYDSTASTPLRSIGYFSNSTISNNSGIATSEYRLVDLTYSGFVFIKSFVDTPSGRTYGENIILIQ